MSEEIPVQVGKQYLLVVWGKSEAPWDAEKGFIQIGLSTGGGGIINRIEFTPTQQWQRTEQEFQISSNIQTIIIELGYVSRECDDNNKIYYDDVEFGLAE